MSLYMICMKYILLIINFLVVERGNTANDSSLGSHSVGHLLPYTRIISFQKYMRKL